MPTRSPRRGGRLGRLLAPALLAAGLAVLLVIAIGQLGTATSSARTEREDVTAASGVVQSTITGTGNLEPVTDEDVDFQTSGTLEHVDVTEGERVHKGELLATLDDGTASLTLTQARATLAEARATLTDDETSLTDAEDTSATVDARRVEFAAYSPPSTTTSTSTTAAATPATTSTATTPTRTTRTSPPTPTPATATTTETVTSPATATTAAPSASGSASSGSSSGSAVTQATIDSDRVTVDEDEQTVDQDETAVDETRLRAPVSGTITSLESLQPGDSVSPGSDTSSAGDSSSDSSDATAGSTSTDAASASSTGSSSSFAVIDSLRHLSMTVSFTESDISKLKVGQAATVSLDALSGVELAAKVTAVSSIGTTSDDVVSYDATLTLEQHDARVKPGMSASATVIIRQGHGVTVPSEAVTGSGTLATVEELVGGREKTRRVIVGIRGDSRDLIVSGLKSGATLVETMTLPAEGTSAGSATTTSSSASRGFGGGAAGGFSGRGFGGSPPAGFAP